MTSLLDTFEEGENEEYNKSGAWEKEYRQNDRLDRSRPTLVRSLRSHPLQSVSCGWNHTVALTVLGEVLVWGDASHGKLGIGKTTWESEGYECYCPIPWPISFSNQYGNGIFKKSNKNVGTSGLHIIEARIAVSTCIRATMIRCKDLTF